MTVSIRQNSFKRTRARFGASLVLSWSVCLVILLLPHTAQAMWLSVYGNVGYDSISSQPADPSKAEAVAPNPSGLSYGLGLTYEPIRFADNTIGIGVGAGLSGWSLSWKTPEEGKIPGAVAISSIGIGISGLASYYLSDLFLYLIGSFDYGLFSSSYTTTRNGDAKDPDGEIFENTVNSMSRLFFGLGVGYKMAGFNIALQGGLANIAINLTPPPINGRQLGPADDSYAGYAAQLVVGYDILAPKDKKNSNEKVSSRDKKKKNDPKKKPKKKARKKKKPQN